MGNLLAWLHMAEMCCMIPSCFHFTPCCILVTHHHCSAVCWVLLKAVCKFPNGGQEAVSASPRSHREQLTSLHGDVKLWAGKHPPSLTVLLALPTDGGAAESQGAGGHSAISAAQPGFYLHHTALPRSLPTVWTKWGVNLVLMLLGEKRKMNFCQPRMYFQLYLIGSVSYPKRSGPLSSKVYDNRFNFC